MKKSENKSFWEKVLYCDPRILYAAILIIVVLFEFLKISFPVPIPNYAQSLYDHIETIPKDKIVVIDCDFASGNRSELEGQYTAVIEHLFQRGIKFAVLTWTQNPEGQKYGTDIAVKMEKKYNKIYGKDYVIWQALTQPGAGSANGALLQALAKDIHGVVLNDINNTPIAEVPMMENVKNISSVGLIYRISYGWEYLPWIGFVQSVYGTPLAFGTAAITSSTAYPFYDSGQIVGMLSGAAGAAAYESMVKSPGMGTKTVSVQSFASLFVLAAIFLGNIAMVLVKISKKKVNINE